MKKTIEFKKVGKHKVFVSVVRRSIDPVASRRKTIAELEQTDEWSNTKEAVAKKQEIRPANYRDTADMTRWSKKQKAATVVLKKAKVALDNKFRSLAKQNIVKFDSPDNQVRLDEELVSELETKAGDAKKNEALLIDGTIVSDFVGLDYVSVEGDDPEVKKITTLGDSLPPGSKLVSRLNKQERRSLTIKKERVRKRLLTPTNRADEIETRIVSLSRTLAVQATADEIAGSSRESAMAKAKDEFGSQSQEIRDEYAEI